jgi:8-oxo-dGTP pyrophosphatase MutT (NUDIX family)
VTDPLFRKVDEREIHQGYLVRLTDSTFEGPGGEVFHRDVVHTPNAVGIVPVDRGADGRWEVVLVHQYRAAVEQDMAEIPAGMCDVPDEAVEATAQRELREEAGYLARVIKPLAAFHPAPGFTTHTTHVVLGVGLDPVERAADGIEEHHMEIERVALDDAVARIHDGRITDGKTVVGLLLARAQLAD